MSKENRCTRVDAGDSDYGVVQSGDKPLTDPMLTEFYDAIWRHWATMS